MLNKKNQDICKDCRNFEILSSHLTNRKRNSTIISKKIACDQKRR